MFCLILLQHCKEKIHNSNYHFVTYCNINFERWGIEKYFYQINIYKHIIERKHNKSKTDIILKMNLLNYRRKYKH